MWMRNLFLLLLALLLLPLSPVLAHGGGQLYVINAPVGGYLVSVSTAPVPLQIDAPIHVTVSIAAASDQTPVLDGVVEVTLADEDGRVLAIAPATTEQAVNKLFYETDFPGVSAGDYHIMVAVSGDQGEGTVEFWVTIEPAFPVNWVLGGLVALLLVAGFFWFRTWQRRPQNRRLSRPPRRRRPVPH